MKQIIRPFTPEAATRLANLPRPERSRFDSALWQSEETLHHELRELGVKESAEYVLMMDVEESDIRLDGAIRANAKPHSQHVAVAFESKRGPLLFACGRFTTWQDNLRAIALGLEALRKVDRYGITQSDEQYTGFRALPGMVPVPKPFVSAEEAAEFMVEATGVEVGGHTRAGLLLCDRDAIDRVYRQAAKRLHPDAGGDPDEFVRLGQARELLVSL